MAFAPQPRPATPPGGQPILNAPLRLITAEPRLTVAADGSASLRWGTVTPTQGGTVYLGLPSPDSRLAYPIFNSSAVVREEAPSTEHSVAIDLGGYVRRNYPEALASGEGILAYRIEIFDPRRGVAQFIDRTSRFRVSNGRYSDGVYFTDGPFLTQVTGNSAIVWWETDRPAEGEVQLAEGHRFRAERRGNRHVARISGLEPGRRYGYRVRLVAGSDEYTSPTYLLRTEPTSAEFSFAFTCDGRTGALGGGETSLEGINGLSAKTLAANILLHEPDFLVFTGDLISGYTSSVEDFRAQLRSWKRLYGPLGRYVPIYTGMGNHESLLNYYPDGSSMDKPGEESASVVFASEFLNPENGPEPEAPGLPPYKGAVYSWDYGGCHFVQLNSDYWYSSDPPRLGGNFFGRLLPGQLAWFEADLQAARRRNAKHIFVFVHEPAFPNGGHVQDSLWAGGKDPDGVAARDRFWKACVEAGVLAVFHGHEHNYSRTLIDANTPTSPDGRPNPAFSRPVWQIIQGAAGAPFYARDPGVPWSRAVKKFVGHTWAWSHVKVRGDSVTLLTYAYTGELLDSAVLSEV